MKITGRSAALRIACIYFLFAAAWILLSDRVVQTLVKNPDWLSRAQTLKGWLFIIATAVLIYLLVRNALARLARSQKGSERVANALAEKQRVLTTLLSNLPGMAYRCRNDDDWTMELVSDGCEELTGHPPSDLISNAQTSYGNLIHPDDRQRVRNEVHAAIAEARVFQLSYRIQTADGSEKWVWEQGCGVYDRQGELEALEGFITDITDQKQSESRLFHIEKLANLGLLTGAITHDFNNILSVITGMSQLRLMELDQDAPEREELDEIFKAAQRGAELTGQLLSFARSRESKNRNLALKDVVREIAGMLESLMGRRIRVDLRLTEEAVCVFADESQLQQVLMNLAVNARDAMPDGGTLTIETGHADLDQAYVDTHEGARIGRHALIGVSDTGVGMDDTTRARIFEPFFTTKEAGKGTGLGLSTVYSIVKQNGGNIWVYSTPGKGTTFKVYLPMVDEKGSPITERPARAQDIRGGKETILIVEDEQAILMLMEMTLNRWGYAVLSAGCGEAALDLVHDRESRIDLVVSDLILPGMTGRELVERLLTVNPAMKVVFTSGHTEASRVEHGLLEPGMPFLAKPFTMEALLGKVRHTLDAARPDPG